MGATICVGFLQEMLVFCARPPEYLFAVREDEEQRVKLPLPGTTAPPKNERTKYTTKHARLISGGMYNYESLKNREAVLPWPSFTKKSLYISSYVCTRPR